jgi:hypothetical protein
VFEPLSPISQLQGRAGSGSDITEAHGCVFSFRFYIESISYLKDNATIELFFLNAKSCIYKVGTVLQLFGFP